MNTYKGGVGRMGGNVVLSICLWDTSTPNQNLNNNLAYNTVMATQEDYDRIQARIDALGEDITRVRRRIAAETERVRSRSL